MSQTKRILDMEKSLAQFENLAAVRLTLIALLVKRCGGRVTVARADLAAFQGWSLTSNDDGEEMELVVKPPNGPVPVASGNDEAFAAISQGVKRGLKN